MPSKSELLRKKKMELVAQCERKGLPSDGKKDILVERLLVNYILGQNFGGVVEVKRRGRPSKLIKAQGHFQQPKKAKVVSAKDAMEISNQLVELTRGEKKKENVKAVTGFFYFALNHDSQVIKQKFSEIFNIIKSTPDDKIKQLTDIVSKISLDKLMLLFEKQELEHKDFKYIDGIYEKISSL